MNKSREEQLEAIRGKVIAVVPGTALTNAILYLQMLLIAGISAPTTSPYKTTL